MSRLNWIIQRSTDSDRHVTTTGLRGNWRDCHSCGDESARIQHANAERGIVVDALGNKGFQDKKKARTELERIRKKFPRDHYRLIKITE